MSRLSVATHISLALAMMTSSLLMVANTLGLVPDPGHERLRARESIAELISRAAVRATDTGEFDELTDVGRSLVERNPDVLSIGVRLADGSLAAATDGHDAYWTRETRFISRPSEVSIPISRAGEHFADLEIRFGESGGWGPMAILRHPITPLALFVAVLGFIGYRAYMRRVLRYLDPSAVVPRHVRLFLDSLLEAVVVVDLEEHVVLANRGWTQFSGITQDLCVGRRLSEFGWVDEDGDSPPLPLPWLETIEDGAARSDLRLFLRTDGRGVRPASARCAPIVGPDGAQRGAILSLADLSEIEQQRAELQDLVGSLARSRNEIKKKNEELTLLATTDSLTGCATRRELHDRGEGCWALAERSGREISCIMVDVDHFKSINDTHGHQIGDAVLVRVGELLREQARESDVVGRYGGEEFCLVLPDTDLEGAADLGERIRAAIESAEFPRLRATASLGVSSRAGGAASLEELLDRADKALYEAKRGGRNTVRRADDRREAA